MLIDEILKISNEFLIEAKSSPRLMEDMAAMEKYMAESYGSRIFIELLQNADDAMASRVKILNLGNTLLVANNGRPFNEADVIAISRSGASTKQRGVTIGYRGVGFKSVAYLTNDIVIYSNNVYFTFSKKVCSEALGIEFDKVPTIRVPFVLDKADVEDEINDIVSSLLQEGFTTVFAFRDSKLNKIIEEISEISNGYFIFLRNIQFVEFNINNLMKNFKVQRVFTSSNAVVKIESSTFDEWLLVNPKHSEPTSIAFKLGKNKIIPCEENEAVFHCFLPTLDKTGYPFKINSDFSTDPSRKHLSYDEITENAIKKSAKILFDVLENALNNTNDKFDGIFDILLSKSCFSKFAIIFNEYFKQLVIGKEWIKLNGGTKIKVKMYKIFPDWIEESEKKVLRNLSTYIGEKSIENEVYDKYPQIDKFLQDFSNEKFETKDFIEVLKDEAFVKKANLLTIGKILGNSIKSARSKEMISGVKYPMKDCYIINRSGVVKLEELEKGKSVELPKEMKETINQIVSASDLQWFCNEHNQDVKGWELNKTKFEVSQFFETVSLSKKPAVSKWRSAEQQCVEVEEIFGNTATDVSKQNLGYDVYSKKPDGGIRYVEVKALTKLGDSFTMTNNEYTAAHQYGINYYLCLIIQDNDQLKLIYIHNPINALKMEKRVRQWEWLCEAYSGEQVLIDLK